MGFNRRHTQLGREFVQLRMQSVHALDRTDDMALEDVPDRDAELAGYGYGGFVAPCSSSQVHRAGYSHSNQS
jgi:hypothetical protein